MSKQWLPVEKDSLDEMHAYIAYAGDTPDDIQLCRLVEVDAPVVPHEVISLVQREIDLLDDSYDVREVFVTWLEQVTS